MVKAPAAIRTVAVFCGTAARIDAVYLQAATDFGRILAESGVRLVYGGAELGLMGAVSSACMAAGGHVIGVMPAFQIDREKLNPALSETHIVDTLEERKRVMIENADGFVVLPGGLGTLDEAVEVLTLKYIKRHDKPIVFADINGFYAPFRQMIEHYIGTGFSPEWHRGLFRMVLRVEDILPALAA